MSTLRERLRSAREAAGLTQDALAKRAHCGQTTIASIENGRNKGATPLPMLAHVLGVEALWLVEGKGPRRREDYQALHEATEKDLVARAILLAMTDPEISSVIRLMRTMTAEMRSKVAHIVATLAATVDGDEQTNAARYTG